jgi:hypothetical protein
MEISTTVDASVKERTTAWGVAEAERTRQLFSRDADAGCAPNQKIETLKQNDA